MRRSFLVVLLLLGTVGGYASGIAHWTGCWHKMAELHAMRERHIAEVCLDAARRASLPPGVGAPEGQASVPLPVSGGANLPAGLTPPASDGDEE